MKTNETNHHAFRAALQVADHMPAMKARKEPVIIDITLSPSWRDTDEEEVRVVRRWYFSGRNEPKPGDAFEEVDLYVGGRLQKPGNLEKDQLLLAQERQTLNDQIAKKQSDLQKLEHDKDAKEQERASLHENLARMGGVLNANAVQIQNKYILAEKEQADAEKSLAETVKNLGMSLAMFRLAPAIRNRLKAEEQLESWESLKRGTMNRTCHASCKSTESRQLRPLRGVSDG